MDGWWSGYHTTMASRDVPSDITLTDWVTRQAPDMEIVTSSEPQPVLQDYNVVAVSGTVEAARAVVLEWERIEPHDGAVGFVALGTPPDRRDDPTPPGSDPRHVVRHTVLRANRGLVPGAVIGAAVVTLLAWILTGWSGVLVGAFVGGAAIGGVCGAFLAFASGTGWGAAYQDSFVEPGQTDLVVASIHSDERDIVAEAIDAAAAVGDVKLYGLGRAGNTIDLHSR